MSSTGNFRDLAGQRLDERSERLIEGLLELAENKGKKTVRHECSRCGDRQEIDVEVMDGKLSLDALRFLSEQGFGRAAAAAPVGDSAQTIATTQADLNSLSDGELILYIAQRAEGETIRERVDRLRDSVANDSEMLNDFQKVLNELRKPKTPKTR